MNKPGKKKSKLLTWLIIATGILILFFIIGKKAGWVGKTEPVKVTAEHPALRAIIETVSANGKIQPEKEVKISSDVSGEIVELYVHEGDSVVKGQLLCKINPEIYITTLDRSNASLNNARAQLSSSKARLLQAEARFNEVKLTYDRNKKLYDQKVLSDAEFETSRSAFLNAQAEVEATKQSIKAAEYTVASFEATVNEAQKSLRRTEIFAPVNGIISRLNVEKGERVVGTSQMAGTEMMRIANLNDMEARIEVNENDIVRVSVGDTALVEVDAYLNRKFKGVVTEVANSANLTGVSADQVTNFTVKVRLLKSSYADLLQKKKAPFRPGMSASVEVQTDVVYQALSIPVEAVTTRDKNEKQDKKKSPAKEDEQSTDIDDLDEVVFVYKDGKVEKRVVEYGIQDDQYIHIVKGLQNKDEVVTGPYSVVSKKLKDGMAVVKVSEKELFDSANKKNAPADKEGEEN
jgi:HlyD family secretion protein